MIFKKVNSFSIDKGYAISLVNVDESKMIAAGSEGHGPCYLLSLPDFVPRKFAEGPGGTMSIHDVPNKKDDLISIMGVYPPFIGYNAGVYYHERVSESYKDYKILDIPFAHRIEWMNIDDHLVLFIASISKYKENPLDWSNPGALYEVSTNECFEKWITKPIIENLTRNHGMTKISYAGIDTLFVSAAEGLFRINWNSTKKGWKVEKMLSSEISEVALIDVDGDGNNEIVTIEPFHGNTLAIYKNIHGFWDRIFETELEFGHGLTTNYIRKEPVVFVGNRRGKKELLAFRNFNFKSWTFDKIIIEEDAGPTQIISFKIDNRDYLVSSNQNKNEVSLYEIKY